MASLAAFQLNYLNLLRFIQVVGKLNEVFVRMKYKVIAIHHIVVKSTSLKSHVHRFISAVSIFIIAEIWHPEIQAE